MFKPSYGICEECQHGREVLIVINKPHLCQYHNRLRKGKEVLNKFKVSGKVRRPTGEMEVFKEIWAERPHVSEVSGESLGDELRPIFFSHILSKGAYPKYRLNKDNILLKTEIEHLEYEFGDRKDPKWDKVKEKYELLKQQYHEK